MLPYTFRWRNELSTDFNNLELLRFDELFVVDKTASDPVDLDLKLRLLSES